ncbi:MAG: hypothetical protein WCA49_19600 [Candidatus Sulfotelmatobacter sp.]
MPDTDHELEAVKIAGEWNKQLSLWATGSIVLSITFVKDLLGGSDIGTSARFALILSWVLLALSIFVGNFAYGAPLTGAGKTASWKLRINKQARVLSIAQATLFVVGIGLLILFAACKLPYHLPSGH